MVVAGALNNKEDGKMEYGIEWFVNRSQSYKIIQYSSDNC